MADSKITKLEWVTTVRYVPPDSTVQIVIDNSFYTFTPDTKPRAFGRKPYLISKEYVPVGEPYDYLAMMNTEWDLGANNAWVVNRKPYKFKDYHLMTTGYDVIGEPVEKFYPTKVYLVGFDENSDGLSVSNVSSLGATTTADITASSTATGLYYLYAEDGKGNKIYTIVGSISPGVVNSGDGTVYSFDELIQGNYVPYTIYTEAPTIFLDALLGSDYVHTVSWSNGDGYGTDYYHTYTIFNGSVAISTLYTKSTTATDYNQSGTLMDVGAPAPLLYNARYHQSTTSGVTTYTTLLSYITWYYKYAGLDLPSVTVSDTFCQYTNFVFGVGYSAELTGKTTLYQYANTNFYVYTTVDMVSPASVETGYSGMYGESNFEVTVPWQGTTVRFYYV